MSKLGIKAAKSAVSKMKKKKNVLIELLEVLREANG